MGEGVMGIHVIISSTIVTVNVSKRSISRAFSKTGYQNFFENGEGNGVKN